MYKRQLPWLCTLTSRAPVRSSPACLEIPTFTRFAFRTFRAWFVPGRNEGEVGTRDKYWVSGTFSYAYTRMRIELHSAVQNELNIFCSVCVYTQLPSRTISRGYGFNVPPGFSVLLIMYCTSGFSIGSQSMTPA